MVILRYHPYRVLFRIVCHYCRSCSASNQGGGKTNGLGAALLQARARARTCDAAGLPAYLLISRTRKNQAFVHERVLVLRRSPRIQGWRMSARSFRCFRRPQRGWPGSMPCRSSPSGRGGYAFLTAFGYELRLLHPKAARQPLRLTQTCTTAPADTRARILLCEDRMRALPGRRRHWREPKP